MNNVVELERQPRGARLGLIPLAAIALILGGLLMVVVRPEPALAATFAPDPLAVDGPDLTPGDGVCEMTFGVGDCSLRAAVDEANASAGADIIDLQAGATYPLALIGSDEDSNLDGDLDFTSADSLTINGNGATIDGDSGVTGDRVLHNVGGGALVMNGPMSIVDGYTSSAVGPAGGLLNSAGNATLNSVTFDANGSNIPPGGSITNDDVMTINDSEIMNSVSRGGVANNGTITINDSQIHDNLNGGGGATGGGFINFGTATVDNTEIFNNAAVSFAGGVHNAGTLTMTNSQINTNGSVRAGAIRNTGTATLTDVEMRGNGGIFLGAAVYNEGTFTGLRLLITANVGSGAVAQVAGSTVLTDSTVDANLGAGASNLAGTTSFDKVTVSNNAGGGLFNLATFTLLNSTISENGHGDVTNGIPVPNDGGGVWNGGGAITLTHVTMIGNEALASGSQLYNDDAAPAITTVEDSIVGAGVGVANCIGTITTVGNNIDSGSSCGFVGGGNMSNTDPLLPALANNGGNTMTHLPPTGSPEVDAASGTVCPVDDQRFTSRPQAASCDIGSVELVTQVPTTTTTSVPIAMPSSPGSTGSARVASTGPRSANAWLGFTFVIIGLACLSWYGRQRLKIGAVLA